MSETTKFDNIAWAVASSQDVTNYPKFDPMILIPILLPIIQYIVENCIKNYSQKDLNSLGLFDKLRLKALLLTRAPVKYRSTIYGALLNFASGLTVEEYDAYRRQIGT